MPRWLVIGVAVVGLIAAAVVEGISSGRWNQSADVRAAAAKLDGVPAAFGDWTSTESPQDEKVLKVAEAAGCVSRIYTNRKTGTQVSVLLLCGPTGPIGAHTPEVCYAGNGFAAQGEPQKKTVNLAGDAAASYWSVRFEKKSATEPPLRVCWMWGVDGDWKAAENPRTEFALQGALYKLYVVRAEPQTLIAAGTAPDPIHEFVMAFLPEVKKALAAPTGQPNVQ
jgi:hypothetical protein